MAVISAIEKGPFCPQQSLTKNYFLIISLTFLPLLTSIKNNFSSIISSPIFPPTLKEYKTLPSGQYLKMKKNFVLLSLILIGLFSSGSSWGQEVLTSHPITKFAKKLSGSFDLSYNSDNKRINRIDKSSNLDLLLAPSYPLSKIETLSLVLGGNKDLTGERLWIYNDTYLAYSRNLYKTEDQFLSLSGISRIFHPTNEESRQIKTLRTKLFFGPQVKIDLAKKWAFLPLTVTYRPYYQQSFHRYKVAYDGKSNTQYSLSNRLILDYSFTEKISLTVDSIYGRSYTYQGNPQDTFVFDQSLGYSLNETYSFSLGHNNEGGALKANGRDSNVEIFNNNKSTFYLSIGIRI